VESSLPCTGKCLSPYLRNAIHRTKGTGHASIQLPLVAVRLGTDITGTPGVWAKALGDSPVLTSQVFQKA
jgi:hypothetical protein